MRLFEIVDRHNTSQSMYGGARSTDDLVFPMVSVMMTRPMRIKMSMTVTMTMTLNKVTLETLRLLAGAMTILGVLMF